MIYNFILFFFSWAPNQPDNEGQDQTILNEACGQISDNGFHDLICLTTRAYICEININGKKFYKKKIIISVDMYFF